MVVNSDQCFFFWRRAKFHPQLGRGNHHNRSLHQLQIVRHCYEWGLRFARFLLHKAVFLLVFYCFDSFLKYFRHKAKPSVGSLPLMLNLLGWSPPVPHKKQEKKYWLWYPVRVWCNVYYLLHSRLMEDIGCWHGSFRETLNTPPPSSTVWRPAENSMVLPQGLTFWLWMLFKYK